MQAPSRRHAALLSPPRRDRSRHLFLRVWADVPPRWFTPPGDPWRGTVCRRGLLAWTRGWPTATGVGSLSLSYYLRTEPVVLSKVLRHNVNTRNQSLALKHVHPRRQRLGGLCRLAMSVQYCWLFIGGSSFESIGVLLNRPLALHSFISSVVYSCGKARTVTNVCNAHSCSSSRSADT